MATCTSSAKSRTASVSPARPVRTDPATPDGLSDSAVCCTLRTARTPTVAPAASQNSRLISALRLLCCPCCLGLGLEGGLDPLLVLGLLLGTERLAHSVAEGGRLDGRPTEGRGEHGGQSGDVGADLLDVAGDGVDADQLVVDVVDRDRDALQGGDQLVGD